MTDQSNDRLALQAVNDSLKDEARQRAQFWQLGKFSIKYPSQQNRPAAWRLGQLSVMKLPMRSVTPI